MKLSNSDDEYPSEVDIKQYVLERIKFNFSKVIDTKPYHLNNIQFQHYLGLQADRFAEEVIYRIEFDILGMKKPWQTVYVPKNWWQMFKYQCFPKWLLDIFPTKMKTLKELMPVVLYPEIKVDLEKEKHYIHYVEMRDMKVPGKDKKLYKDWNKLWMDRSK